ncbi:MAG TPA: DUF4126 family protein [Aliidongia sp.]|nr:DUF4126 family protein [Aliidongia sp.]
MIYVLALAIGVVAGLRALLAPAVVSWAASSGFLDLSSSWLAFAGYRWTPWILTLAAAGELVTDQLPSTPSRKVPPQFIARLVMGGLSGAAIATAAGSWPLGMVAGVVGAVIGTLLGARARGALAAGFGNDHPAAILEDIVALGLAIAVVAVV